MGNNAENEMNEMFGKVLSRMDDMINRMKGIRQDLQDEINKQETRHEQN